MSTDRNRVTKDLIKFTYHNWYCDNVKLIFFIIVQYMTTFRVVSNCLHFSDFRHDIYLVPGVFSSRFKSMVITGKSASSRYTIHGTLFLWLGHFAYFFPISYFPEACPLYVECMVTLLIGRLFVFDLVTSEVIGRYATLVLYKIVFYT